MLQRLCPLRCQRLTHCSELGVRYHNHFVDHVNFRVGASLTEKPVLSHSNRLGVASVGNLD